MARRVLVTGAGSGLGLAIARTLSEQGDEVMGTVRSAERAETLSESHPGITYHPLELSEEGSRQEVSRTVEERVEGDVTLRRTTIDEIEIHPGSEEQS